MVQADPAGPDNSLRPGLLVHAAKTTSSEEQEAPESQPSERLLGQPEKSTSGRPEPGLFSRACGLLHRCARLDPADDQALTSDLTLLHTQDLLVHRSGSHPPVKHIHGRQRRVQQAG